MPNVLVPIGQDITLPIVSVYNAQEWLCGLVPATQIAENQASTTNGIFLIPGIGQVSYVWCATQDTRNGMALIPDNPTVPTQITVKQSGMTPTQLSYVVASAPGTNLRAFEYIWQNPGDGKVWHYITDSFDFAPPCSAFVPTNLFAQRLDAGIVLSWGDPPSIVKIDVENKDGSWTNIVDGYGPANYILLPTGTIPVDYTPGYRIYRVCSYDSVNYFSASVQFTGVADLRSHGNFRRKEFRR